MKIIQQSFKVLHCPNSDEFRNVSGQWGEKIGLGIILDLNFVALSFVVDREIMIELSKESRFERFMVNRLFSSDFFRNNCVGEIVAVAPVVWQGEAYKKQYENWNNAMVDAESHYRFALESGATEEEAAVMLPTSAAVEVLVVCSIINLREIISSKTDNYNGKQMRALFLSLAEEMNKLLPKYFARTGGHYGQ